mmetsp:Transcript_2959/g.3495  ORF Transcript_2959/g.3495 Transcript_2959/m.3495 type:complete len:272 (-) Transcript_2959:142-957(-)
MPGGKRSTAVVHRSISVVPRIDVASDQHDLPGPLVAHNVNPQVARLDILILLVGRHVKLHGDILASAHNSSNLSSVFHGKCSGSDVGRRRVAGVRTHHGEGSHTADETAHSAVLLCPPRALGAVCYSPAVALPRHVEQHDLALHLCTPVPELSERAHHNDLRRDRPALAVGAEGPVAHAQTRHGELLHPRREHLRMFGTTDPLGDHDQFLVHSKIVFLRFALDPVESFFEVGGAAKARSKGVRQLCKTLPQLVPFLVPSLEQLVSCLAHRG